MLLKFADGSTIEVRDIFGGPRLVMGHMRDVLRIEVDPSTISFEKLRSHFKNNPKTVKLYTLKPSKDNPEEMIESEIGIGYRIFMSISEESRKVVAPPGKLMPETIEEIYVVQIAQQTYEEYMASDIPSEKEG